MKAPLLNLLTFVVAFASCVALHAAPPAPGKTQQLTSPDQVPDGLAKSDWHSIRAAYEAGRHAFKPTENGWQALNPGQQWTTQFDRRGFVAKPKDGRWTWGLELQSYGFGELQQAVRGTPAVKADGQRLSYQWDATVQEWFVNDQRGLEHGFTISERPKTAGSGELSFTMSTRGSLSARVNADAQGVSFQDESGATVLNYAGLKVWDDNGNILPSRFEPAGARGFRLLVDESTARYPITIDPIAQQAYLKANNTGAGDAFGFSVAVGGDTVIVGAIAEGSNTTGVNSTPNESASVSGAAYVFVRNGTTWSQQAYLKASQVTAGDRFGYSVAVSGNTAVISSRDEDSSTTGINSTPNELGNDSGAAYVFVRSGTTWSQQAYLKASQVTAFDNFGTWVTVAGDTVVVGAPFEDGTTRVVNGTPNELGNNSGAAYVFVRSGTTWSQQAYLKPAAVGTTAVNDTFGVSVAVAGDTVVVGANNEDSSTTGVNSTPNESAASAGAAYVFVRSGTTWTQQAYLKPAAVGTSQSGDYFGYSVAVDGDTVVVGANFDDSNTTGVNSTPNESATDAGAAYVFVRSGTTWTQQAYLKPAAVGSTQAGDNFGYSVAISGDALVIGAHLEDSNTTGVNSTPNDTLGANASIGAAYVFARSGTTWTQQAYLKASQVTSMDYFGGAVGISGDTVIAGSYPEDSSTTGVNSTANETAADAGAAYVFTGFAPAPEIAVEQPAGINIGDGSTKDFGSLLLGNSSSLTFTVKNTGNADLTDLTITKDGANAADFTVTASPTAPVTGPSGSTTFAVRFAPGAAGARTAAIHIANNDSDENPFDITLTGTGSTTLAGTYTTGSEVLLTTSGFTATGNTLNASLNFAPPAGTDLTVVDNTGAGAVVGTFTGLPEGTVGTLAFGGTPYFFILTYTGGTGNDIVLRGNRTPVATADALTAPTNVVRPIAASYLTANDSAGAAFESSQTLTVTAVSSPSSQNGTVALSAGVVTYTPANNFTGTDTFTYTLSDGAGGTAIGTVTMTVNGTSAVVLDGNFEATTPTTIDNPVTFTSTTTFGGTQPVTLNGPITLSGTPQIDTSTSVTINGVISGTAELEKTGSGTLILTNANQHSGGTKVSSGTVELGHNQALGTGLVKLNGGHLRVNSTDRTLANTVHLSASTNIIGTAKLTFAGALRLTGAPTMTVTNQVTIEGVVQDDTVPASLEKKGKGVMQLRGANTFSGGFKATQGTVGIGHNSALGTGPFQLKGAGVNALDSPKNVTNPVQLTASTSFTGQKLTLSGAVQVKGKRALTTQSDVDITGTISELSSGSKSTIEKKGAGKLTLSGNNTHKGGVTAKQGTLAIGHNFALGSGKLRLGGSLIESTNDLRSVANPLALEADTKIQGSKISLTGKVKVSGKRAITHENDVDLLGPIDAPSPAARTNTKVTKKGLGTLTLGPASKTQVAITSNAGVLQTQGKATSSVEVLSNAPTKDIGMFVNQVIVSGNPAMVYYDNLNADLIYVRATDASGTAWGSPVKVATAGDAGKEASLQVVNGHPAIAYYQADNSSLNYVRSEDVIGTTWATIVKVPIERKGGRYPCLRVINGKPAISYNSDSCDTLNYVGASDSNGMTWNPSMKVFKTGASKSLLGRPHSLLDVGGAPAICYFNASKSDLNFVKGASSATAPSGVSWATPVKLDSIGDVGQFPCLKIIGGNPAVSYYDETKRSLKYARATNAAGTTWGRPVDVDSNSGGTAGQFNSLEVVDGNPAISHLSTTKSNRGLLSFVRATDSTGGSWSSSVVVDIFNRFDTGRYSSLLVVDGRPAIADYDATNKDVRHTRALDSAGASWPSIRGQAIEEKTPPRAIVKAKDSVTKQKQVRKGGTLANGASPGVMSVDEDMTWEGGAVIEWEINDATGLAGLNWDLSNVGGALAVNATADEPIMLGIVSLRPDNGPGNCANFNPFAAQSWRLVNAGGVTDFSAAKFVVSSGAFSNDLRGGGFSIVQNGANLDVVFTPGPVTNPDITVEHGGTPLASGGAFVDYGTIAAAGATTHTITIRNDGTDPLTELQVLPAGLLIGEEDADVSITEPSVDTLNPGQSTTFGVTITNNAASAIPIAASLVIASNDPDENQFVLSMSANGGAAAIPASEIGVVQDAGTVNLVDGSVVPVSFGTVNTGGTASQSFTISNSGNADLTGLGFVVDGVNASDFRVSASPVSPVASSGTTTFTIEFTPSTGGTRNAAIHFASNDGDESPFDILLTGTGTAAPEIAVENNSNASLTDGSVTAEEFGTVSVNSYEEITFTVRNEGTLDLTSLGVSIDGTDASQFSISSALGTTTITPDGSASLTVRFAPTSSGAKSAALHITSNDADEPSFDILLSGEGVIAPEMVVEKVGGNLDTGDTVDVGVVATGSTADYTFTIKNTGSADLTDLAVSVEGDDAADFTVTADPAATLNGPSGSTTFIVRFAPSSIAPKNATLRIDSNDSDEAPFDIVLSSAGQPPEIAIEDAGARNIADGGSTSFGSVILGSSTSLTFTIRNTGLGDLTGLDVSMDGAHASDFIVTASPVAPVSGSGGSTTFTVEFTPTGTGTRTAAIHIENNDGDENPYDIAISGSGLAPEIALEQGGGNVPGGSTQSFGTVVLGTNSSLVFTIRNLGTSALNNVTAGISGTHAGDFILTSSPASTVSGPSGSTTFTVLFTPASLGSRVATLQILNNDPDENPIQINLTGTGMSSNPLDVWRFSNLGTTANSGNTSDLGDFDNDGITNLAEFAFGTNPQTGGSGPSKLAYNGTFAGGGSITTTGQPDVAYESRPTSIDYRALFVRRKDHATAGLTYTVQFSSTLGIWQTTTVTPTVLADDGVHQVVSVPYMNFIQGRKVKFFRVQVALSP